MVEHLPYIWPYISKDKVHTDSFKIWDGRNELYCMIHSLEDRDDFISLRNVCKAWCRYISSSCLISLQYLLQRSIDDKDKENLCIGVEREMRLRIGDLREQLSEGGEAALRDLDHFKQCIKLAAE